MTPETTKAVRLAAAAEAFADGTALVLVRELLAFLEGGITVVRAGDEPAHVEAGADAEAAQLRAEVARLTGELSRAQDAARKRARRQALAAPTACAVTAIDSRQATLFVERPDGHSDVRTDVPDVPLSGISDLSDPKKSREVEPRTVVLAPDSPMPDGWLERTVSLRPDLPPGRIPISWGRFVGRKAGTKHGTFPAWAAVQVAWESWIENERLPYLVRSAEVGAGSGARASPDAAPPPPPFYRPPTLARPDHEPAVQAAPRRPPPRLSADEQARAAEAHAAVQAALSPPPHAAASS